MQEQREVRIQQKQKKVTEDLTGCTFKPETNPTSENLVSDKLKVPLMERLQPDVRTFQRRKVNTSYVDKQMESLGG